MKKAVFFDRDGTLCKDAHYPSTFEDFQPFPDVVLALKQLQAAGFELFIVTNQSGVARGYFSFDTAQVLNQKIIEWFSSQGVHFLDSALCPHHPQGTVAQYQVDCNCRKPQPGMILELAQKYQIDLAHSYMLGDKDSDVEAGKRAGCQSVLIGNPHKEATDIPCYRSVGEFVKKELNL